MKLKRNVIITIALAILIILGISVGSFGIGWNDVFKNIRIPSPNQPSPQVSEENITILKEENLVIDVVERVSPSVVTVGISTVRRDRFYEIDPFDPFNIFRGQGQEERIEQDIGSGFVVSKDGLIVTNKHVVADTNAKYRVITKDDQEYTVEKIYRDPTNDLAIIKISASDLQPVTMGDSSKLKVGQFVVAIGTALGEFRHTVTTGVISGLGRGITTGSPFEGFVERLDNVIQTDAAINPGNSGGPLLGSGGQVIGVNTAIASSGQNIGFAIPINVVKDALENFNQTGQFSRPFLGIKYKSIDKKLALLNDVPEGAYIVEVVSGSPAEKSGLKRGDIIININNQRIIGQDGEIATIISQKKVGETVSVTYWRDGKEQTINVTLVESTQ
ncbi:trypsin-like peptidase domain-containing protein [Candidatus Gottesmanbacteria bacterium]|nr:trypsin-like peptidase domain-containing protein [Candidatus Gottesmanbacteria bacterium]